MAAGRPIGAAIAAVILSPTLQAAAGPVEQVPSWCLIRELSSVTFTGTQAGAEFEGNFESFSADIAFDPNALDRSSITVTIDMASVDAGNRDRNEALPNAEWFHVSEFPTATFSAGEFQRSDDNRFNAAGTLTIRGKSNPIELPFKLDIADGRARATGSVTIDRRDYDVGQGMWASDRWVAYPVSIGVDVAATQCDD